MCSVCISFPPSGQFVAVCSTCDLFTGPLSLPDAEQIAGEHDDDRHHGEPTATVHRARWEPSR